MAFVRNNFGVVRAGLGDTQSVFVYKSSDDTLATVKGSGYFDDLMVDLVAGVGVLSVNDIIMLQGSDDQGQVVVTAVTTAVTVANYFDSSIIADGAVTKAKLATGVKPSHMIIAAGNHTTIGGAATENITATGALATDLVFMQMQADGATPRTILAYVPGTDIVTVEFSGDPSTDHVVTWSVVRPTS